jgi:hypothetical protein
MSCDKQEFGQRHFILSAPDGLLLDVIQSIAPSEDYADANQAQQ